MAEEQQVELLKIYPNPAKDYVVCNALQHGFVSPQTEVINVLGQRISAEITVVNHQIRISTTTLNNGFYLLQVIEGGTVYTGRFMVAR